jgi:poly-gamma-glutamate system protein
MNISVYAALEVLKCRSLIISSVGASDFGANDPYFTWLDMEHILYESGIFHTKSVAASIGGGSDIGRGLSPEGRLLILNAIERNQIPLINEENLIKNIEKRMQIYSDSSKGKTISAYINIGGGIASLGHTLNSELIPSGLTMSLVEYNYPIKGVIVQMGEKGIPVIQLMNIKEILKAHNLPYSPVPMPKPGSGGVFVQKKYDFVTTLIAAFILTFIVVLIFIVERKHNKLGTNIVSLGKPDDSNSDDNIHEL